jgi:DNA-binding response OmpR family regulator
MRAFATYGLKTMAQDILLVDSEQDVAEFVSETLNKAGFSVDVARSGVAAVERVNSQAYKAAILASRLPDGDGLELFDEIKERQPEIPAILITTDRSLERLKAGERCIRGVLGWVVA